jgi:cobalt-zinc-cadmium efflux system outer membrane protein
VVVVGTTYAQSAPIPAKLSLQEAIALARDRNPNLIAARAFADAMQADRVTAGKRPNPAVTAGSEGYPLFESSRPGFWSGQEFTVRFDQELETGGRRRLRTQAAATRAEASQLDVQNTVREIELQVRRTYIAAVLAQADLEVSRNALTEIDKVIALNRARFDQGEISGAELRRVQVERLRFVDDVFAADLALKNARSSVLALLNASALDQPVELTEPLAASAPANASPDSTTPERPSAPAAAPVASQPLLAEALAARPDVQSARRAEAAADTETRLQRALRTPNITAGGGYRRQEGSNAVVFSVTVPIPLFNQNQGGIARADAERRAAAARVSAAETTARLDVQQALNAVETNRARVAYIEREYLNTARETRNIVLESYRVGAADLIDFLDAQRAFRDTLRTYNRALYDARVSQFEFTAALGQSDPQK